MKKHLHLIILMLLPLLCLGNSSNDSSLKFEKTTYNMGDIKEEGGSQDAVFKFTNISKKPVVIEGVTVSCGCTTTSYSRKPIMAGESGEILVTYDPMYRPGHFDKTVVIFTNNRRDEIVLAIRGKVIPRTLTVEERYPYDLGGGILASSSFLDFNYINLGRTHTSVVDIYNNTGKLVGFSMPKVTNEMLFSYYMTKQNLEPGESAQLIVTFDLTEETEYKVYNHDIPIFLKGADAKGATGIKVRGISVPRPGKESFNEDGMVPVLEIPESYHYFPNATKGDDLRYRFEMINMGGMDLEIKQVLSTNPKMLTYSLTTPIIAPEQREYIEAVLHLKNAPTGRVNEQLIIITNDPSLPVVEVRVSAQLKK